MDELHNVALNLLEAHLLFMEEHLLQLILALVQIGGYLIGIVEDDEDFNFHANWEYVHVDLDGYRIMGDPSFKRHFRLSKACFELLLTLGNHLLDIERIQRVRTPLDVSLLMVLWVLANPDTFRSISLRFGVQPGTLHFHYCYVIQALREMVPRYIRWPNEAERIKIKEAFEAYSGFPGIVGVIDGTHNVITAPVVQERSYRNRHDSHSLNTQVICNHQLLIIDATIGEAGSLHDQRVLTRSPIYERLLNADENFMHLDEHLIGDGAYTLIGHLLVPFRNIGHLTEQQRQYNLRLCRCRARIEHTFAKAFGQWRRMKMLHVVNMDIAVDHIMAYLVLHNFMNLHGEVMLDFNEEDEAVDEYLNDFLQNNEVGDDGDLDDEDFNIAERLQEERAIGVEKRWEIVNFL